MAERRMFTKKITEADQFTELPPTAQALYFHLCMSADDDGFSNEIRKAMFNAHASTTDFNVLVAARFILPFDSGVIVIKHWKMHNYIRNDRYNSTAFVEEKAMLILKENGVYTEKEKQMDTVGIPNGYQMDTQVRLGKDSLDKGNDISSERANEMFKEFWDEYPRKDKKKEAERVFLSLHFTDEKFAEIMDALRRQKRSRQWQDKHYIPMPPVWLRGERWTDEMDDTQPKSRNPALQYEQTPISEDDFNRMLVNLDD